MRDTLNGERLCGNKIAESVKDVNIAYRHRSKVTRYPTGSVSILILNDIREENGSAYSVYVSPELWKSWLAYRKLIGNEPPIEW